MNFDNRSMALNDESTQMILDPTIGRQMDQIFLDDLRHTEEITLAAFRAGRGGHDCPSALPMLWCVCYEPNRQFATIRSAYGVKITQERLGHASITTTLTIDAHAVDASHRQAIEAVEHALFPNVLDPNCT
jgi:integrase